VVAFDGEHTFVAVSPDEKAVIMRLASLKDPKLPTLRTRAGLEALKGGAHATAGFVSLRRFGSMFGLNSPDADASKLVNALPHHGETPIPYFSDTSTDGPDSTLTFSVPRAAIEDIGALVPVLALMATKNTPLFATP
jgi:hypothetical protein